jgi:hypothetical protein
MIRNLMLAAGLFAFTAGSAMAATQPHAARTPQGRSGPGRRARARDR